MWATNAQRHGRSGEYRWRPLLTPTNKVPRGNSAKTRYPLKCDGVPQTRQSILAVSGLKCTILWEHVMDILLLNKIFPIVDAYLGCEDIARKSCAMVPSWPIFGDFWVLHLQGAARGMFPICILNFH